MKAASPAAAAADKGCLQCLTCHKYLWLKLFVVNLNLILLETDHNPIWSTVLLKQSYQNEIKFIISGKT